MKYEYYKGLKLRDWQRRFWEDYERSDSQFYGLYAHMGAGKSMAAVLATVTHLLRNKTCTKVLYVAPSEKLCKQTIEKFNQFDIKIHRVKCSTFERKGWGEHGVAICMQSLRNFDKLEKMFVHENVLIVADECHHFAEDLDGAAKTKSTRFFKSRIMKYCPKVLCMTGTPWRLYGVKLNDKGDVICSTEQRVLGMVYNDISDLEVLIKPNFSYTPMEAFEDGVCLSPEILQIKIDAKEIKKIKETEQYKKEASRAKNNNVYRDDTELNIVYEQLVQQDEFWRKMLRHAEIGLNNLKRKWAGSKCVIYAPNVAIAKKIHKVLGDKVSVLILSSKYQSNEDREKSEIRIKKLEFDYIINVRVLGEGFDCPNLKLGVIIPSFKWAHPSILAQMIHRVGRRLHNGGEDVQPKILTIDTDPLDMWVKFLQSSGQILNKVVESNFAKSIYDYSNFIEESPAEVTPGRLFKPSSEFKKIDEVHIAFKTGQRSESIDKAITGRILCARKYKYQANLILLLSGTAKAPECSGVYHVCNITTWPLQTLYIGTSWNLQQRLNKSHHKLQRILEAEKENGVCPTNIIVKWCVVEADGTSSEADIAANLENQEIKLFCPKYNDVGVLTPAR